MLLALTPGTRVGVYEIAAQIGEGGMGQVFRARDTNLNRDVALKILPPAVGSDPDRLARFTREARTLASFNHLNIAHIHGFEEFDGLRMLVMELVEGDDLSQRLARGRLSVDDALRVAAQIAEALEAAHERGVVHRDLKPANIKVRPDGVVKVLDFGLAKAMERAEDVSPNVSQSPTVAAITEAGVIIGTAAYMSPEQARGRPIDRRTDIWAFGCVLYEMLTGRRAFAGDTTSDTMAAVLEREPQWDQIPDAASPRIHWLLRRCLQKDPRQRLHDIADARIEIEEALAAPADRRTGAPPIVGPRVRERIAWTIAALSLVVVIALLAAFPRRSGEEPSGPVRMYSTAIVLPEALRPFDAASGRFALSPNGEQLAIAATDGGGRSMLYLRRLNSNVPQPLAGTEGAAYPFWSPDSRFVGFLAQGKLKKISAAGGEPVTLADVAFRATGTWNQDDVILFTPQGSAPLFRVSAVSGAPAPATALDEDAGEVQHSFPFFLPDGRRFLYFVVGSRSGQIVPRGVYVGSLDGSEPAKLVVEEGSNAKFANGHLIYLRGGSLFAQRFDLDRLELQGDPVSLVEDVERAGSPEVTGAFTVSQTGLLAYQGTSQLRSQLTWFDRTGNRLANLGEAANHVDVALSPDGSRVATSVMNPARGTRDLWTFDVQRGLGEPFTFDPGDDIAPNWSWPNGDSIYFSSLRQGSVHLYEKSFRNPSGTETLLRADDLGKFNPHPSTDGRFLLYVAGGGIIARSDIWLLSLTGARNAAPFIETAFVETQPQFSADGRWVAYTSFRLGLPAIGRPEVYVTSFPARDSETRVSASGGSLPRWNRNGREIFYVAADGTLTVVSVDGRTSQFVVGAARALFPIPRRAGRLDAYPYDVSADGQRILVNAFLEEVMAPITLVVNWHAGR